MFSQFNKFTVKNAGIILIIGLLAIVAGGQQLNTGSVRGKVVDANGSLIVGANVIIISANGAERATQTNQEGLYLIGNLPAGKYSDSAAEKRKLRGKRKSAITAIEPAQTVRSAAVAAADSAAAAMTLDAKTAKIYLPTAEFGATPAPTKERPNPRPSIVADSFVILVFGK